MTNDTNGPITKEMIFDLAKSIEAMLPRLTKDLREIKATIDRIEQRFRRIGG